VKSIEAQAQNCNHETGAELRSGAATGIASRIIFAMRSALKVLREVLRGFSAGHPPDDPRPRKGCC
jgi:hypothetical protein